MRTQMAKIGVLGTFDHQKLIYLISSVLILILLTNSFYLVSNCFSKMLWSHFLIPK